MFGVFTIKLLFVTLHNWWVPDEEMFWYDYQYTTSSLCLITARYKLLISVILILRCQPVLFRLILAFFWNSPIILCALSSFLEVRKDYRELFCFSSGISHFSRKFLIFPMEDSIYKPGSGNSLYIFTASQESELEITGIYVNYQCTYTTLCYAAMSLYDTVLILSYRILLVFYFHLY